MATAFDEINSEDQSLPFQRMIYYIVIVVVVVVVVIVTVVCCSSSASNSIDMTNMCFLKDVRC